MTIDEAKEILPTFQAFCEGKAVQFFSPGLKDWRDDRNPDFIPGLKWRVKPRPVERWVVLTGSGNVVDTYKTWEEARESQNEYDGRIILHAVEQP